MKIPQSLIIIQMTKQPSSFTEHVVREASQSVIVSITFTIFVEAVLVFFIITFLTDRSFPKREIEKKNNLKYEVISIV